MKTVRSVVVILAVLIVVAFATPSDATEQPDRETITISWYLPDTWNDPSVAPTPDAAIWGQTLVEGTPTCGRWIQADTYWLDLWLANRDAILANGYLDGPHEDGNMLAYGTTDGNPWGYVWTGDCATPTPTPEPSPTPTPPVECEPGTTPGWLDDNGNPTACIDDNPDHTPTSTLADTGAASIALKTLGALVLVGMGAVLIVAGRRNP